MTQQTNEQKIYEILGKDRPKLHGNEESVHSGSYFLGIRNKNTGAIHVTSKNAKESEDDIWMYDGSEVTRTMTSIRTVYFYNSDIVTDKPRFRQAIRKARVNMAQWEVITIDWGFAHWTRTKDGHFSSDISKYVDESKVTVLCDLLEYDYDNGFIQTEVTKTESPVSNEAEVIV
tara:strand:- start:4120 stop:4641 length:522 start_codon:yes stop_codon:yes gene_type:complete